MATAIIISGMLGFMLFLAGAIEILFIENWKQSIYTMCLGFGFFIVGIFLGMNSSLLSAGTRARRRRRSCKMKTRGEERRL